MDTGRSRGRNRGNEKIENLCCEGLCVWSRSPVFGHVSPAKNGNGFC